MVTHIRNVFMTYITFKSPDGTCSKIKNISSLGDKKWKNEWKSYV